MTESQTLITPRELLDTSIGQLRILAAFLGEQLCERDAGGTSDTAETRACNAILDHVTLLVQKLESTDPQVLSPWRHERWGMHPSNVQAQPREVRLLTGNRR
jgi:hypothetical protein